MTDVTDSRFFWDEAFGQMFFEIRDRAYELLPDESDDEDIARAVSAAIDEQGAIDWSRVRTVAPHWIDSSNIFTHTDALVYLPQGFADQVKALPAGEPTDTEPFLKVLSALVTAEIEWQLDNPDLDYNYDEC